MKLFIVAALIFPALTFIFWQLISRDVYRDEEQLVANLIMSVIVMLFFYGMIYLVFGN